MNTDTWSNDDIPLDKPNPARIYDYLLGGHHNFEADRVVAEQMIKVVPELQQAVRNSRKCMRRFVNFLIEQGIDQFLDIGSGLPTLGNVHQLVQQARPAARVVYVDLDPVAVAHGRAILQEYPGIAYIQGDIRQPAEILGHNQVQNLLDFNRPMAVVLASTLAFVVDDEEAYEVVRTLRDAMAPGSYIVIVHASFHSSPPGVIERLSKLYAASTARNKARSYDEILRFFDRFELVEPGLVHTPAWQPDEPAAQVLPPLGLTGVGRLSAPG